MRKLKLATTAALAALGMSVAMPASATVFVVDAAANSTGGGSGLGTIGVAAAQLLSISAGLSDLWSAGDLPRWSNADGLVADTFATGSDESGASIGTQIGADYGLYDFGGLLAPYGALVGEIGGEYKFLGTAFNGTAWKSGTLNLFYWDSNNYDNRGSISVDVSSIAAVPEPATWLLSILGFGFVGSMMRRRAAKQGVATA